MQKRPQAFAAVKLELWMLKWISLPLGHLMSTTKSWRWVLHNIGIEFVLIVLGRELNQAVVFMNSLSWSWIWFNSFLCRIPLPRV
eukprot:4661271-Amphidinium_carterae.1